jgi:hypothetical protein
MTMLDMRIGWDITLASMLLTFMLCSAIAALYSATYSGLSYSRAFVQTLALSGLVSCLVMLSIGRDLASGLGLIGALSLIRFRSTLKDTRDLMFVFASLCVGVACGVQSYMVACIGTAVFLGAATYVSWSPFGSRHSFDAVLKLHLPAAAHKQQQCQQVLQRFCNHFALVNLREVGGEAQEHIYHVKLASPDSRGAFIESLNAIRGLQGVTLLMQDRVVEV